VIDRQMQYITHKDLGFDKTQVLIVHNTSHDFKLMKQLKERLYAFARTQPSILSYSAMNGGLTGGANSSGFVLDGQQQHMRTLSVDYNYFELLGLKFVSGRPFSPLFSLDTAKKAHAVVVNETLFKLLGKDARLGVFNEALGSTIIGVVHDYHFESLSKKIMPEEHRLMGVYGGDFLFRVKGGEVPTAIAAVEKEWKEITHNYPFEYTFLDQSIAQMYEADLHWEKAVRAASFFAILIACMGLFGLSAINAVNRTKEIGIRKVLGAEIRDLVATLSSGFLGMVAVSIIIAAPLAWWLMNKWLEDFAYRIEIRWWMFVVVGLAAVAIAFGTVSYQVIRAARANPVRALRSE
jgi:putative ABC transport system permease protein